MRVSVVIPTYNEATTIAACLRRLARQEADDVVVVDASSPDGTSEMATGAGARVILSPKGRGVQQNRGAAAVPGDVLLFLHADCWLQAGAVAGMRAFVRRHPRVPGGCFRMSVLDRHPLFPAIEAAAHVRAGMVGVPYGDQGIFVPRWAFEAVGGFPELGLMEDVFLSLRLRRLGRIAVLPWRIHASARRWRHQGILRQTARNWALTALAAAGLSPDRLAAFYPMVR